MYGILRNPISVGLGCVAALAYVSNTKTPQLKSTVCESSVTKEGLLHNHGIKEDTLHHAIGKADEVIKDVMVNY